MESIDRTPDKARNLASAACDFLESLDDEQRHIAQRPFNDEVRYEWSYIPVHRGGLRLDTVQPSQRELALLIMDIALSERGGRQAREIMALETTLAEWETITHFHHPTEVMLPRNPEFYYVTIYGNPHRTQPWGFKVGGHHIGIHITVVDGDFISPLPLFFGTNPAEIRHGPQLGHRVLGEEEDMARDLLASFSEAQKLLAIVDSLAPNDILTENYRSVSPGTTPLGLSFSDMEGEQRTQLANLVRHYVDRSTPDIAKNEWRRIESSGLVAASFAWAGPEIRGEGHYYSVTSHNFLIEYDNTQNDANHVHSVWRGIDSDWGEDLLQQHYQNHHTNESA
jgi:hypothetical protein